MITLANSLWFLGAFLGFGVLGWSWGRMELTFERTTEEIFEK